jgi:hypothetical protein
VSLRDRRLGPGRDESYGWRFIRGKILWPKKTMAHRSFSEPAASGRALPHVITGQLPTSVFRDGVIANETMAAAISGGFERSGSDRVLRFLRTLATMGQSPLPKNARAPNTKRRTPILHAPCLRIMSHLQFAAMFRCFALPMTFVTQSVFARNRARIGRSLGLRAGRTLIS